MGQPVKQARVYKTGQRRRRGGGTWQDVSVVTSASDTSGGSASATLARAHGRPQEENLEVPPRQAPRHARDRGAARQHVPAVRLARSAPTASARPAAPTRAAKSSRSASRLRKRDVDPRRGRRARRRQGPGEVILGALDAAADGIDVVALRARRASTRRACRSSRRPTGSRWPTSRPRPCARSPTRASSPRFARSPSGDADAVVSAGNTGAMLAAGLLHLRRLPGRDAAGDRRPDPGAQRAVRAARRRRERRRPARAPAPVRAHGRGLQPRDARTSRTPTCACSRSARKTRRATS